jgi:hypothetical protein
MIKCWLCLNQFITAAVISGKPWRMPTAPDLIHSEPFLFDKLTKNRI